MTGSTISTRTPCDAWPHATLGPRPVETRSVASASPYAERNAVALNPFGANRRQNASSVDGRIGSAPLNASRHERRSSARCSSSYTRRTHKS
ncbi:MAG: hypothetical protein DMF85_18710 [Acidobacteria bacterium]|nr:MAG: hypothetical protein DMF85_18710 [Acidobacteriota bacterium]